MASWVSSHDALLLASYSCCIPVHATLIMRSSLEVLRVEGHVLRGERGDLYISLTAGTKDWHLQSSTSDRTRAGSGH